MNHSTMAWRSYDQLYSLNGFECASCHKKYYQKKYVCSCGASDFEPISFCGKGKLVTFTEVRHPSVLFKGQSPYILGIVELEEGVRVLSQITDAYLGDVFVGMPVRAVFRKLFEDGSDGVIAYGIKFVPLKNGR